MLIIWMFPRDQLFRSKTNILIFESWLDPNITLFWFNNNKSEKIKQSINNNNVPDKRRLATWKFPLDPKKMVSWKHSNDKYALATCDFCLLMICRLSFFFQTIEQYQFTNKHLITKLLTFYMSIRQNMAEKCLKVCQRLEINSRV